MPTYKLTYFDIYGRAEASRYLFALAGVEFEDRRVTQEEWKTLKSSTPQGQLPTLTVDGVEIPQSLAIVRYLAREFGLYGSNNLESTQIDVVVQTTMDMMEQVARAIFQETDEKKKEELKKKFREESMPKFLRILSDLLAKKSFMVGDKVSLADVFVFNALNDTLVQFGFLTGPAPFPNLTALVERIRDIPEMKTYLGKRKDSQF